MRAPKLSLFGADLSISTPGAEFSRPVFRVVCVLVCGAAALAVAALRSRAGVVFLAVRNNERAASAAGLDVARMKLVDFAISAALAGVGGVLLAYQRQSLSAQSYQVFVSRSVVALTYLAGITPISGALLAEALAPEGFVSSLTGSSSPIGATSQAPEGGRSSAASCELGQRGADPLTGPVVCGRPAQS